MSEIWIFSPGLEDKVQQCIAAASPNENNKWQRMFKKDNNLEKSNPIISQTVRNSEEIHAEIVIKEDLNNYDELLETVDVDPVLNLSAIIKESIKNPNLLNILATKMSSNSCEKLCAHIFKSIDIDHKFLTDFYTLFLPTYIKNYEINLEFLIRAKSHIVPLKKLITVFVTDVKMSNKILQDFVNTFNVKEKTEFLIDLSLIEIPAENIVKNMFTILLAYKESSKSNEIQSYILTQLKNTSHLCTTDKIYGKLFLTFLQTEKAQCCNVNKMALKDLIEMHKSPFKRPCMNIINELLQV